MDLENKKSLFQQTLESIEQNKINKDLGIYNSIPFGLPSLDKHVPGIMKGIYYGVTANSGVGKSQVTKFLFVLQPYKFIKAHPELGLSLKIIWIALEESKEEFMLNLICNRLKEEFGITISALQLKSMGENTLSDQILQRVRECAAYFEELEECLEVVDSIYNPTGLYKHCRNYASANGEHYYRPLAVKHPAKNQLITAKQLNTLSKDKQELYCYYTYVPNNPKEFVIVANDHVSLITPEYNTEDAKTLHMAMGKWSSDYVRKMLTKRFNYCCVDIQQQEMAGDKQQFTNNGDSVVAKLTPSLDKLASNKEVGRNYFILLGLFAPERYGISEYLGYNITKFRDNFRELSIIKNRLGTPNLRLPLYFNGASNTFLELPPPKSEDCKKIENKIDESRQKKTGL